MNEKQSYVDALVSGATTPASDHEARALKQLRTSGDAIEQLDKKIGALSAELDRAQLSLTVERGKASGLAEFLWQERLAREKPEG
jgi:hypothetical protein